MKVSRQLGGAFFVAILLPLVAYGSDIIILRNGFSIRHERREVINQTTRLFVAEGTQSYIDVPTDQIVEFQKDDSKYDELQKQIAILPSKSLGQKSLNQRSLTQGLTARDFSAVVSAASERHHLDSDFINSVIHAESGFNSRAVSQKGAQGLMQLMPQTASQLGIRDAFDATANVDGGTRYLRELLDQYHGNVAKALAAYNAGPARVAQYRGIPPYHETHAYVARIIRDYNRKKLAQIQAEKLAARTDKVSAKKAQTGRSTSAAPHSSHPVAGSGS